MSHKLNVYISSNMGCIRDHNEDMVLAGRGMHRDEEWQSIGICLADDDRYVAAVCDGMGGHNGGEVASEEVASQLSSFINDLPVHLDDEALRDSIWTWHSDEHEYLNQRGYGDRMLEDMGTTLAMIFVYEGRLYWGNCGDSRIYKYSNGHLMQLSTDHSLYLETHNVMDLHVITNCMGGGCQRSFLDLVDITEEHKPGDLYLLCSDGLTDMVDDYSIEAIISTGGRAKELTMEACDAGGDDNVSVCIVEFQ